MKTIKQLEKEIKFEDENAGSYVGIQELKAKLQTLKEVLKEINKVWNKPKKRVFSETDLIELYNDKIEELKQKLIGK